MDSLEFLTNNLGNPWRSRVRSILVDESLSSCDFQQIGELSALAYAVDVSATIIQCELAHFEPFFGPRLYEPAMTCEVCIPVGCNCFTAGMWFGFKNAIISQQHPLKVEIGSKSAIWSISGYEKSLPISLVHLCAGAFGGWDRAFKWLNNERVIFNPTCVAIESDFETLKTWSVANEATIYHGPIDPSVVLEGCNNGVLSPIQDFTWYNCCRQQVNILFTASPPCQTWSNGGKQQGLEAENGMTFIQVVADVKWVRPIACLIECSDTVPSHKHYPVIQASFRYIGYRQVWSQVVPLHDFTGMKRTRWVTLFIRGDVQLCDSVESFRLEDSLHKVWSDPAYDFYLPSYVVDQLRLTNELKQVYGNPQFLPQSKKIHLGPSPEVEEVLNCRCIKHDEILPTLCASYASQHVIDRRHLANKGIFAALCFKNGNYAFIDPARFAALLGATGEQGILFPRDIHAAFHQLGNSISVVHAVLGATIALSIVGFTQKPIRHIVNKCWESRIIAKNTVTMCNDDFVFIVNSGNVNCALQRFVKSIRHEGECIKVMVHNLYVEIPTTANFCDLLLQIGIESPNDQGILLTASEHPISFESVVNHHCGQEIVCSKGSERLFVIKTDMPPVEPTLPWPGQDASSDISHEDDFDLKEFQRAVIEAEENLRSPDEHPNEKIAVYTVDSTCGSKFITMNIPINLTYEQTAKWIANATGHPEEKVVWYETQQFRQPHHQRCLVAAHHDIQETNEKFVIVHITGQDAFACRCPNPACTHLIPGCENSKVVHHNGRPIGMHSVVSVEHGDDFCVPENNKKRKTQSQQYEGHDGFQQRVDLLLCKGSQLGTDEYAILQRIANESQDLFECADVWEFSNGVPIDLIHRMHNFLQQYKLGSSLGCPILIYDHWASVDFTMCPSGIRVTFCNVPSQHLQSIQNELIRCFCQGIGRFHFQSSVIPALHGFCGWAILHRWFQKYGIQICCDDNQLCPTNVYASVHKSIEGEHLWGKVSSFALQARLYCFQKFSKGRCAINVIRFGATATDSDATMHTPGESTKQADPWLKYDPWQNGRKQCKWEDLTLPKDHPIHDSQKNRLQQAHRHQLNPNLGGVAFCTKSTVNEILGKKPKQPFALILPANDKLHFDESLKLKVHQPQEITVEDGASGAVYKRQVVVAFQGDDIVFELPKPSYKGTLTEKSEIVLEVHSALLSKEAIVAFRDKPHETIKSKVADQFPAKTTDHINIYGIKTFQEGSDHDKFKIQAMCKIEKTLRPSFLEASGAGDIIARDFIPKGEQISDITVIPKFWPIDKSSKAEALRSAGMTEGFAGLLITKRGLAVRAWACKVANIRRVLISQDERITSENINVVPTITYDSTGWPSSASPSEVIQAITHSCGTPPIPTRCFRALGVVTWTLGFSAEPKVNKFSASFNGTTYEILLTKPVEKSKQTKGSKAVSKGSSKGSKGHKEHPIQHSDETSDRLTNLETKFAAMERRQDTLETKLQSGFEGVQDQLRQVLKAVQPRAASPSPTGFTPPPKIPKSS